MAVAEPTIAETEDVTQDCDNVATGMSREQLVSEPPIWADEEQVLFSMEYVPRY